MHSLTFATVTATKKRTAMLGSKVNGVKNVGVKGTES